MSDWFVPPLGPNQTFKMPTTAGNGNPALVKSSSGSVYNISMRNTSAAERYVKLYDLNRAPVIGADIPFWTDFVPPQDTYSSNLSGYAFVNGLSMSLSTGPGDLETSVPAAGEIVALNISYR